MLGALEVQLNRINDCAAWPSLSPRAMRLRRRQWLAPVPIALPRGTVHHCCSPHQPEALTRAAGRRSPPGRDAGPPEAALRPVAERRYAARTHAVPLSEVRPSSTGAPNDSQRTHQAS